MVNYLEWREDYNVGHPLIDSQHRRIVEVINTVYNLVKGQGDKGELSKALGALLDYTIEHFTLEESIIKSIRFPESEEHKLLHLKMRNSTQNIVLRNEKEPFAEIAEETLTLLKNWWLNHIRRVDIQYKPYLEKLDAES